ncbi:MAG TPA: hypothetical protein DEB31_00620 [Clostridiales bacterium]|nr:hypothetical protein [Clostridiales bacterium]
MAAIAAAAITVAVLLMTAASLRRNLFLYTNPLAEYGVQYPFAQNGTVPEDIVMGGQTYTYNKDLVNVLFIGYDETVQREMPGIGFQADTLVLAVINKKTGGISVLSIPRDTVTDFPVFDFNGNYATVNSGQVALSHAYGREYDISNDLTMASVSNLLYQIPIGRYFALNIDGIGPVNDAAGGVNLELLADFTAFNPEMSMGTMYTLWGDEAELYVRARQAPNMSGEDLDRMKLQKQYIAEFVRSLKTAAAEDFSVLGNVLQAAQGYSQSNLEIVELLYLAVRLRNASIELENMVTIPGHAEPGGQFDSVYITDEEALKQMVLDVFFVPAA